MNMRQQRVEKQQEEQRRQGSVEGAGGCAASGLGGRLQG